MGAGGATVRRGVLVLLAAAAAMAMAPSAASASLLRLSVVFKYESAIEYIADPGERNDVVYSPVDTRLVSVVDRGATIRVERAFRYHEELCHTLGHAAFCETLHQYPPPDPPDEVPPMTEQTISLGDADDALVVAGTPWIDGYPTGVVDVRVNVDCGAGHDSVVVGQRDSTVNCEDVTTYPERTITLPLP